MRKINTQNFLYSLRSKLTIFIEIFIGLLSVFIFFYFPSEFEKREIGTLNKRAKDISVGLSASASLALVSQNPSALDNIFYKAITANQLSYLIVTDDSGFVYKSYNYEIGDKYYYLVNNDSENFNDNLPVLKTSSPVMLDGKEIGYVYLAISLADLKNYSFKLKVTIGVIGAIFILTGFMTVFTISSIITRPIFGIVKTAEKISSGDFSQRSSYKGNDELGVLSASFNLMAFKLEKAQNQIETLTRQAKTIYQDKIGELNLEINQRRLAEHSLRRSEEQFRLLFELAPIGMVITSLRHEILKTNNAFCGTLGYTSDELNEININNLTHPDDVEKETELHDELILGKQSSIYFEKRFFRKDKEIIYSIVESTLVRDDQGKPVQFIRQVIDITERKKVEQELVNAKDKAEESDRLKSAFLAQMSHEIRTPLNIILNAIPLLADEYVEKQSEPDPLIEAVNSAGKRLLRTIDLILNLSSVQTGNYIPEFEDIEIDKELYLLTEEFKHLSIEKNIELYFRNTLESPKVVADKYTLNQIFQNLIGNAIKYTLKGKIDITLYKNNEEKICVDIKDTGIGMSENYLAKLFSPFSQEDVGYKREFEGNGLGLALVKKYSELNKAEIKVTSEKEKGSVFTLILVNAEKMQTVKA